MKDLILNYLKKTLNRRTDRKIQTITIQNTSKKKVFVKYKILFLLVRRIKCALTTCLDI